MINGIVQLGSLVTLRRYRRADQGPSLQSPALHVQDRPRRLTQ
jgi:hypothetical protein